MQEAIEQVIVQAFPLPGSTENWKEICIFVKKCCLFWKTGINFRAEKQSVVSKLCGYLSDLDLTFPFHGLG